MKLDFSKLNGLGNDFIFVNDLDRSIELTQDEVVWLCDRRFGVGADGVILVRPSERSDCNAYMHYINSDGTLAQMCGNGVRCFAKYLVDRKLADISDGTLTVETLAGPRLISYVVDENGLMAHATVDMGAPILDPALVPVNAPIDCVTEAGEGYVGNLALSSPWGDFTFVCVSMGNPHAVCFVDLDSLPDSLFPAASERSLETLLLDGIGAYFESHEAFPEKANIEFATIAPDGIHMRVYERGCGETLACGTGACATSTAAFLTGRAPSETDVVLKGGTLHIKRTDVGHVMMTGSAMESYSGIVEL